MQQGAPQTEPQSTFDHDRNAVLRRVSTFSGLFSTAILSTAITLAGTNTTTVQAEEAAASPADTSPSRQSDIWDADPLMRHPLDNVLNDTTPIIYTKPKSATLKIISWDLGTAVKTGLLEDKKPIERSWRNTFGAEMRATWNDDRHASELDADIVLLQNISSIRETRKLFPARRWNVIFSKPVLGTEADGRPQRRPGITAVAQRYSRGLRVTGRNEPSILSDRQTVGPTVSQVEPGARSHPAAAGLAVRFSHYGDIVWVVSTHLARGCTLMDDDHQNCPKAARWSEWQAGLPSRANRVLYGGAIRSTSNGRTSTTRLTAGEPSNQTSNLTQAPNAPKPKNTNWFSRWFGTATQTSRAPTSRAPLKASQETANAPREDTASEDHPPSNLQLDCSRLGLRDEAGTLHTASIDQERGCIAEVALKLEAKPNIRPRATSVSNIKTAHDPATMPTDAELLDPRPDDLR
ncbi:MAG: hypothetical protein AAFO75_02905 [Pseudomonadota bacterium]